MNITNMKVWTDLLRSGKYPQGKKRLANVNEDGEAVGFCCLGVGCIPAGVSDDLLYGVDGEQGMGLPPKEFHLWLGTTTVEAVKHTEEEDPGAALFDEGMDVLIDWPEDLRTRDGSRAAARTATTSCAGLNDDCELTFGQIADIIDYFGVKELELE